MSHSGSASFALVCLFVSSVGCSGSTVLLAPADGGSASDATGTPGALGSDAGSTPGLFATGTCTFTVAGKQKQGTAYARMNGTGNLTVVCGEIQAAAASPDEQLRLNIGNGAYAGPGEYTLGGSLSEGAVFYTVDSETEYAGGDSASSGCKVVVTAPQESFVPKGSVVLGTFTCAALESRDTKTKLDLAAGQFSAPVR